MGQLEKYGLYVLCLVIFLILGVTIWGGGELPQSNRRGSVGAELNAGGPGGPGPAGRSGSNAPAQTGTVLGLLQQPKNDPKKNEARTPPAPVVQSPVDGTGATGAVSPAADKTKEPPQPTPQVTSDARPTHKVQSGDSFESIAKKLYGSASLRTEIARLNPRVEPTRMRLGQELLLPTKAEAEQILGRAAVSDADKGVAKAAAIKEASAKKSLPVPAIVAGTTYTVAKGDTLESIAVRQLGSRTRLDDLREANPSVDPTKMKIGQKIQLPKK